MESVKILLLSIASAVIYGIAQDQVTARVCVEYFTVGHPPVFRTDDPTLLGLGWGVIATWWVGAILWLPLCLCARAGSPPRLAARDLVKPILILLLCMAVLATIAGFVGYGVARRVPHIAAHSRIPAERWPLFMADAYAHSVAYAAGFLGGIVLCVLTVIRRFRLRRQPTQ